MPLILEIFLGIGAGLLGGSFLTVVVIRGPAEWGLVQANAESPAPEGHRSCCPSCRTQLNARQLIPLVSFALQRGMCASCSGKISRLYPILEGLGALAGLVAFTVTTGVISAIILFTGLLLLIGLGAIDHKTGFLPDRMTLPFALLGMAAAAVPGGVGLPHAALGGAIGYGAFWAISAAYKKWRGIDGLGMGDAKLLGGLGIWVGAFGLPFIILLSSLGALAIALTRGHVTGTTEVRYGPYLAAAGAFVMILGHTHFYVW